MRNADKAAELKTQLESILVFPFYCSRGNLIGRLEYQGNGRLAFNGVPLESNAQLELEEWLQSLQDDKHDLSSAS